MVRIIKVLGRNISAPVPEAADSLFPSLNANPEPEVGGGRDGGNADGGGLGGGGGAAAGAARRQLAVFPFEHPSAVATTFDVTFHLPDASLVACRTEAVVGAAAEVGEVGVGAGGGVGAGVGAGVGEEAGASGLAGVNGGELVEVGRIRSPLLTWRMLRFVQVLYRFLLWSSFLLLGIRFRSLSFSCSYVPRFCCICLIG